MSKAHRCECETCGAVQASYDEPGMSALERIDRIALCCVTPDYYYMDERPSWVQGRR